MDTATLGNLALVAAAFGAAFLTALWFSLILWTYRDIRSRSRDPLLRILALLVVAVLFLPGILIYLILRPPRTLEEEYQRTLEEEALLQNIEDTPLCPGCTRRIQPDWQICPNCHTRLKKNLSSLRQVNGITLEFVSLLRHTSPRNAPRSNQYRGCTSKSAPRRY